MARPTALMRMSGITPPGEGQSGERIDRNLKRLCVKLPARSSAVGTLVIRVMPSRARVPS